jgi:uncharacterized protein (TIGR02444 family)
VTDSPFWQFSLRFYALPDVAPTCLELQDHAGVDVNLLLLLLYLADSRFQATSEIVRQLDASIASWREEAVKPLRGLRRRLKTDIGAIAAEKREAFRNQIKKVELEAERLQQMALEAEAGTYTFLLAPSRAHAARANLAAYGAVLGGLPANPLKIVLQAFTDSPP